MSKDDEVDVIAIRFLDPENPVPNKQIFNDLILEQGSNMDALMEFIVAEQDEGRNLIVQINTGTMTQEQYNGMSEWEP
jgi:hypothetical protein